MGFRGAGGAADAVAPGAAAQQDDEISGGGALAADILRRGGGDDRAHLQPLGHIAGVVQLVDNAGGKADLVAVGGVARGGGGDQLALGQLPRQRLGDGLERVGRAGDAHGAVDVAAPGEGVADGAADAGGRAAEGLDLRGVVVGFVFKQEQPGLRPAVDIDGDLHGAGVDLLRLVELVELPGLFQGLDREGAHVHEGNGLDAAQVFAGLEVVVKAGLNLRVVKAYLVQGGGEGGMAAVIGPVGVDDLDLGDGGFAAFTAEVIAAKAQIVQIHGKAARRDKGGQGGVIQGGKARERLHRVGHVVGKAQGFGQLQRRLAGLDGVDDVFFQRGEVFRREVAGQDIDLGGAHGRPLPLGEDLDALGGGVGPLVKLARQILHGKDLALGVQRIGDEVDLRLGKDGTLGGFKEGGVDVLHIVAVDNAHALQGGQPQEIAGVGQQAFGLVGQGRLLFNEDSVDHGFYTSCWIGWGQAFRAR